jgi:lipopolysaccharide transport system ATP-binding protein
LTSHWAIKAAGLGKRYTIAAPQAESYTALRDVVSEKAAGAVRSLADIFGRSRARARSTRDVFWALRDVTFEIEQGERIGVIGRNGAGKSTLLKILSRVTDPSAGEARIRGRVASLLEVGTGFHPELTGRENVFLNGAILGMTHREITTKFDNIVSFAEVERFLDLPVKRYSSGMAVRLAFAVAAHLDPEILVVDEVLAVGDTAFQRKCIDKMQEVASKQGRTVLFVSHSMGTIVELCDKTILLDHGRVADMGPSQLVTDEYVRSLEAQPDVSIADRRDRTGNQALMFSGFELQDGSGKRLSYATSGQDVALAFKYCGNAPPLKRVAVAVGVHGVFDEPLFYLYTALQQQDFEQLPREGTILCKIPRLPLQPGSYTFNIYCTVDGEISDWVKNAGSFDVETGTFFASGALPPADQGSFLVEHAWAAHE